MLDQKGAKTIAEYGDKVAAEIVAIVKPLIAKTSQDPDVELAALAGAIVGAIVLQATLKIHPSIAETLYRVVLPEILKGQADGRYE